MKLRYKKEIEVLVGKDVRFAMVIAGDYMEVNGKKGVSIKNVCKIAKFAFKRGEGVIVYLEDNTKYLASYIGYVKGAKKMSIYWQLKNIT